MAARMQVRRVCEGSRWYRKVSFTRAETLPGESGDAIVAAASPSEFVTDAALERRFIAHVGPAHKQRFR